MMMMSSMGRAQLEHAGTQLAKRINRAIDLLVEKAQPGPQPRSWDRVSAVIIH